MINPSLLTLLYFIVAYYIIYRSVSFPKKHYFRIIIILSPFVIVCAKKLFPWADNVYPIQYIIIFTVMYLSLRLLYQVKRSIILWISMSYNFSLLVIRGISMGCITLYLYYFPHTVELRVFTYDISFVIATIFLVISGFYNIKKNDNSKLHTLFSVRSQFRLMTQVKMVLLIYLIFITAFYFNSTQGNLIAIFRISSCIFASVTYYIVLKMTTATAKWMNQEDEYITLKQNWDVQLRQYERQNELINNIRHYDHDLKHTIRTISNLLENNKIKTAQNMLSDINNHIQQREERSKQYSNHALLDTLLFNYETACEDKKITFIAECYLPNDHVMNDVDLCRVFNNIFNNAYEASLKLEDSKKRFISIISRIQNDWLVMSIKNKFSGELIQSHDTLLTTKEHKDYHGMGITNVENIVKKYHGMSEVLIDQEHCTFTFMIYLPIKDL